MTKEQIENKIAEIKKDIKKDECMMEEDSQSMYWFNDYSLNLRLLSRYEEKLKEISLEE